MSCKILLLLVLVGLLAVKTTNAEGVNYSGVLTSLVTLIKQLTQSLLNLIGAQKPLPVRPCGVLENGKQYYIKTEDGRYAVLDKNKQLAFVKKVPSTGASKFTAIKKSCNVYGLCIDNSCMSRCEKCTSDTGDYQTVKFNVNNSNSRSSQWTLTSPRGVSGGPYNLKIDGSHGFLRYKRTKAGNDQLTLSTVISKESNFVFEKVEQNCGILKDGKEYLLKSSDGRYAVLDKNKQLAFLGNVPETEASKFSITQKSCNVYGLCVDGNCMSRCEACASDTGDSQTVKFNLPNSDDSRSQWTVTFSVLGGPYNLKIDGKFGYLTTKKTRGGKDQFTLSTALTARSNFMFVEAPTCNTLAEEKEYILQASDGRYAILDKNKQLAFMKQVPAKNASIFAARQNGCNVYGLYVDAYSMSRCEGCESDTGDNQTVKFRIPDSDNSTSHWTITSSEGGFYNFKIDGPYGYLMYKKTAYGDDQLTLTTVPTAGSRRKRQAESSSTLPQESNFQFVEPSTCDILKDGKEYFMKTSDGRYAVLDQNKQLAFVKQIPEAGASRFSAVQKGCNVYGLCVNGNCMSRCEACESDIDDYQTVKFHAPNSDSSWSQWTITSLAAGGFYNLKIDDPFGYLTYKTTPFGDDQYTLSNDLTAESNFEFVEAPCNPLEDGKEYFMKTSDGRYAVLNQDKQLAFVKQIPEGDSSRFSAVQKGCNVYGLCVNGNCMSRCEACESDIDDYQTVKFHAPNSDNSWSQWTITSSAAGGFYNLNIDYPFGYLTYKTTPFGDDQYTLSNDLTTESNFQFVEAPCNILEDGTEYFMKTLDGRYAVLDEIKQLAFVKQVPEALASRFTAVQKGCNVYGLCVNGNCMSRCEACESDADDYQTVKFHLSNSDNSWSQWVLAFTAAVGMPGGGIYHLKVIDFESGYLVCKQTPNDETQLSLSGTINQEVDFQLVKVI